MHLVSCFWHMAGISDEKNGWVELMWPGAQVQVTGLNDATQAPKTVSISGFICHSEANAVYTVPQWIAPITRIDLICSSAVILDTCIVMMS